MPEKDCNNTESLDFFQNYECNIKKILEKITFENENENDWKSKHVGYFNIDYFKQIDILSNKIDGKSLKKIIEECHHAKIIENINRVLTRYFISRSAPLPPPPGQNPVNKQTKPKRPPIAPKPAVPPKPKSLKLTPKSQPNLPPPANPLLSNSSINPINELNILPPPPPQNTNKIVDFNRNA